MTRIIIILGMILAIGGGQIALLRNYYNKGYAEAERVQLIAAEAERKKNQVAINAIEQEALKKIALQIELNLEKVITDAKRANPTCSFIVPRSVSDALRGPR